MLNAHSLPQANMQAHWHAGLLFYTFGHLAAAPGLVHGFSTRLGGVSTGGAATLSLAPTNPADTPAHARENLRRFGQAVGFDHTRLVLTQQTHSTNIHKATAADAGRGVTRPLGYTDIDGLLTDEPNLPLISHHADCTPLFFYEPERRICGVAHAGWRGTADGMARAMVTALCHEGAVARKLLVGIGPAAGPCHYQVGPEVAARFAGRADEQGPLYRPAPQADGKYLLDLWRANRLTLIEAGVPAANIVIGGLCTICHPELFYSYRVQGSDRGSLAAAIMLTAATKEETQP